MRRRGVDLLTLSFALRSHSKHYPLAKSALPTSNFLVIRTLSTSSSSLTTPPVEEEENTSSPSKSQRDSLILEQFKQRKLKGSSSKGSSPEASPSDYSNAEKLALQKGKQNEIEPPPTEFVTSFKELGVSEELVEVMEGIGGSVPSEIQCVVIPPILEGKSVLLSSPPEPDRTLAFLLPLIQLLRQDKKLHGLNSKHPRAIVLCATEENAEQCFNAAKYLIDNAELKSGKDCASPEKKQSNASISLMIGTPSEIVQYIEEGIVIPSELKYLVLDETDCMLGSELCPEIHKILRQLKDHELKSTVKGLQTILAISTIAEVLGEESPLVKRLERDHAGNISSMSLEMEQTEVFNFTESLDALRKKVAEAMDSLLK